MTNIEKRWASQSYDVHDCSWRAFFFGTWVFYNMNKTRFNRLIPPDWSTFPSASAKPLSIFFHKPHCSRSFNDVKKFCSFLIPGRIATKRGRNVKSRIGIPSRTPFILLTRVCLVCSLFSLLSSASTSTLSSSYSPMFVLKASVFPSYLSMGLQLVESGDDLFSIS